MKFKNKIKEDLKHILIKTLNTDLQNKIDKITDYIFETYFKVIYFPDKKEIMERCEINLEESEIIYQLYREKLFLELAGLVFFYMNNPESRANLD